MKKTLPGLVCASLLLFLSLPAVQEVHRDVPYVPTPYAVVDAMLKIANVGPNDILYDLGCGDGRIVVTAAKNFGTHGTGIDIDPNRIAECRQNAMNARVTDKVRFLQQNLFNTDFHDATVVTLYLLSTVNLKLRPTLLHDLKPGTRVVSHDFSMGDWRGDRVEDVDDNGSSHTVYFWIIPANVSGAWEWDMKSGKGQSHCLLDVEQEFQNFSGTLTVGGSKFPIRDAKLEGDHIRFTVSPGPNQAASLTFDGRANGDAISGTVEEGGGAAPQKQTWNAKRKPGSAKPLDTEKIG